MRGYPWDVEDVAETVLSVGQQYALSVVTHLKPSGKHRGLKPPVHLTSSASHPSGLRAANPLLKSQLVAHDRGAASRRSNLAERGSMVAIWARSSEGTGGRRRPET